MKLPKSGNYKTVWKLQNLLFFITPQISLCSLVISSLTWDLLMLLLFKEQIFKKEIIIKFGYLLGVG